MKRRPARPSIRVEFKKYSGLSSVVPTRRSVLSTGISSRLLSGSQTRVIYDLYNKKLILNELLIQLIGTRVLTPLSILNGL